MKTTKIKNLIIVESPAKAKKIESFLGSDYTVMASIGHIRSIAKKAAVVSSRLIPSTTSPLFMRLTPRSGKWSKN